MTFAKLGFPETPHLLKNSFAAESPNSKMKMKLGSFEQLLAPWAGTWVRLQAVRLIDQRSKPVKQTATPRAVVPDR